MTPQKPFLKKVAALFILGLGVFGAGGAWAQALEVSPISIEFQPGQQTTTLTVTNQGSDATVLQVRPFRWRQSGNTDELTNTDQLLVSPPITDVPAGETQTFRLVLTQTAPTIEASYRLFIDQIPPAASAGVIRIAIRLSIPVFAEPQTTAHPAMDWRIDTGAEGDTLVGVNTGTKHAVLVQPIILRANGRPLPIPPGGTPYILPGAERSWALGPKTHLVPGSIVHLQAKAASGPVDVPVHVTAP